MCETLYMFLVRTQIYFCFCISFHGDIAREICAFQMNQEGLFPEHLSTESLLKDV